jgi:hypothetical protein
MEETLRVLISLGLGLLLVLLRLDAERFGAAEYDERVGGQGPPVRSRLAWYLLGVGLIAAVLFIHPDPANGLGLGLGERGLAIIWGFCYGALGALIALGVAWLRYGHLRLPDPSSYPGALSNALFTAFIDEATFRGIILGLLLVVGLDPWPAVVIQALLYALVTRTGAPGRPWQMLLVSLVIGVVGGVLTIWTQGIGAAFIGHGITRFSIFLATGHPGGQFAPRGREDEELLRRVLTPEGWRPLTGPGTGRGPSTGR